MKIFEGGNVFKTKQGLPATQRINRADVPATVRWLEKIIGIEFPEERWLGSTGRTATSGDLDLAVDVASASKEQIASRLTQWANDNQQDPREWVKKSGEVHFKTPIAGDANRGFVQTDFMFFPDVNWGTFYYAGGADSEYKGMVRNVLMSSLAKSLGLRVGANGMFSRTTNQLINGGTDPDRVAQILLGPNANKENLKNVENIYASLATDSARNAKLADFREYLSREGLKEPTSTVQENEVNFLARLRDRLVNQGMQPLIENYEIFEQEPESVGGRAKGIEHLEDLVFRQGAAGVDRALAIADSFYENPKTGTVKWDGKPAIVFGRKPDTGEFVLTDGTGFEAIGTNGLFTSIGDLAQDMSRRDATAQSRGAAATRVNTLLPIYKQLWPMLEAAVPENFRGYVKGDLLYTSQPEVSSGNFVFQPNTVEYRIPVNSALGKKIADSQVAVAMHTMYADAGAPKQPLSRVKFNPVPGLLLLEPIYAKPVEPAPKRIKEIRRLLKQNRQIINTLFNPAELRAMKITDLAKLAVDYINKRINPSYPAYTGDFKDLVPGFIQYLKQTQTTNKFNNIVQYLRSPSTNEQALVAAFVIFELLHDLKLDILSKLDAQVPGNEGWVLATPAGYSKAVNRFDFTQRNRMRNNP